VASAQNASDGSTYRGGKNPDLTASQPIENIDAESVHFEQFAPSRPRASFRKELHFEEWAPRISKKAACITYKLTDGKQVNTGYGRASRPLGYVTEISPGRWVARVGNLSSEPLSLGAARKRAVELHRSKDEEQRRDWIHELNRVMVAEIDRANLAREKRRVPINLMGGHRWLDGPTINAALRASFLETELWQKLGPTETLKGDDYPLQTYSDGYPKLPRLLGPPALARHGKDRLTTA
jgi:hypothetical protein